MKIMEKLYFWMIGDKMEVSMELLRSNYVYIQVFRSIRKNLENIEDLDFLVFVCWQERDLSVCKIDI